MSSTSVTCLPPVSNTCTKSICYGVKQYVNCRLRVVLAYNSKKTKKKQFLCNQVNFSRIKMLYFEIHVGG